MGFISFSALLHTDFFSSRISGTHSWGGKDILERWREGGVERERERKRERVSEK